MAVKEKVEVEEKDVIVKISSCNTCKGEVRIAVKHLMDVKSTNSFAKEVMQYNLSVTEMPLLKYNEQPANWCKC